MTIDELMAGKEPGSIRITTGAQSAWFKPYFKAADGRWYGLDENGEPDNWWSEANIWFVYTEPKPPKPKTVLHEVVYRKDMQDLVNNKFATVLPFLVATVDPEKHIPTGRTVEVEL